MSEARSIPQQDGRRSKEDCHLTRDEIFELLSNRRRRHALHELKRNGRRSDLGALAGTVASWENGVSAEEVTPDQRKRVYTSLQQFHLPKLEEMGIVEFDRHTGTVELTDRAVALDLYLEVVEDPEIPWSRYYLGLSMFGLSLSVAAVLNVPPFTALGGSALAVFVVTAFLLSAAVHAYHTRAEMRLGNDTLPPEVDR